MIPDRAGIRLRGSVRYFNWSRIPTSLIRLPLLPKEAPTQEDRQ